MRRRGEWAPRRGAFRSTATAQVPAPPVGGLIESWTILDLKENHIGHVAVTNVELITSFNWISDRKKSTTILIPGKPARWSPPATTTRLKEDVGEYYRDQNAARYPDHPMEPTVLALLQTNPKAEWLGGLDIVACASTIGNLLRFVRGQDKPFRILVEAVGDTVFFVRRENSPTETIPNVHGFGHTFPEAYTSWEFDVKGSESHQRLLNYQFCGLSMIVRHEGDGYLPSKEPSSIPPSHPPTEQPLSLDELILGSELSVPTPGTASNTLAHKLQILEKGQLVEQSRVFDLKTRSKRKKDVDVLKEELPRLWISQIPNFILAWHKNGLFDDITIQDVTEDVKTWEKDHETDLTMLGALLHILIKTVQGRSDHKLELRHKGDGCLEIRQQLADVNDTLSSDTRVSWLEMSKPKHSSPTLPQDILDWASSDGDDYTACTDACGYCGFCNTQS